MAPHLIVVEGLPGSGKSTLSQSLMLAYSASGCETRWYSELEVDHPLAYVYRPDRDRTLDEYVTACRTRWQHFLDDCARETERTVIVDAWLLQDPVFSMLLANVERRQIVDIMSELWRLVPRASSAVLYLTQRDVPAAVEHFCASRGPRMRSFYVERNDRSAFAEARGVSGPAGLNRFWTEHRAICDAILADVAPNRIDKDVSARNWPSVAAEVLAAFDLELPWRNEDDLERFTGSYRLDETAATFDVVEREGRLLLRGFPFFWRDADQELLPLGSGLFAVQSWPATVRFEVRAGVACSLDVTEQHRCGQAPWPAGSYART